MAAALRNELEEYLRQRCLATLAKYTGVCYRLGTLSGTPRRDARSVLLFLQSLEVVGAVLHEFLSAQALITADKRILL